MKALILAPFDTKVLDRLGSRLGIIYQPWTGTRRLMDPEDLINYIQKDEAQVVVMEADFIFEEVFEGADKLRFIGVCRGAVNNVDLDSATQYGVMVVNTPARNSIAVAELTIGLALSLVRRIPEANGTVKSGNWSDPVGPYISLRGTELSGKTAGIIGLGAIGRETAKRLQAFGMTVLAYDPYIEAAKMASLGIKPADLKTLASESDIISIHCISSDETRGLLDAELISRLKPTAYLINTASWDVADETALISALANHKIAGAAFDIFATHPLSTQSPLLKMDNVILTPHIGGATDDTIARYSQVMAEDILRFLDGKRPLNLLNPEAWVRNGH